MYKEFEDPGICDEDDIGYVKHLRNGWEKGPDYYDQIKREKAYIAFIECYVPYKEQYDIEEFRTTVYSTLSKVKKLWDRCLPDGNMSNDIDYWIKLLTYYGKCTFDGKTVYFGNTKWEHIDDDIILTESPIKLMNNIYKANIFTNWNKIGNKDYCKAICNVFKYRINPRINKADKYRNCKCLSFCVKLAELFDENKIQKEITDFIEYLAVNKTAIINYLRKEIYEYNKYKDFHRLGERDFKPPEKMEETYINNLRIYDMIANKNLYY